MMRKTVSSRCVYSAFSMAQSRLADTSIGRSCATSAVANTSGGSGGGGTSCSPCSRSATCVLTGRSTDSYALSMGRSASSSAASGGSTTRAPPAEQASQWRRRKPVSRPAAATPFARTASASRRRCCASAPARRPRRVPMPANAFSTNSRPAGNRIIQLTAHATMK